MRQAADRINYLRKHPLAEVRDVAELLQQALSEAHPNSFGHKKYPGTEKYNSEWMKGSYYLCSDYNTSSDVCLRHNVGVNFPRLLRRKN